MGLNSSTAPLSAPLGALERVMGIEPTSSAWKAEVLPLNYTRKPNLLCLLAPGPAQGRCMVEGVGFEPTKAKPADLQSAPVGRLGTPPDTGLVIVQRCPQAVNTVWSWRPDSNRRPAAYKAAALPTELRQLGILSIVTTKREPRNRPDAVQRARHGPYRASATAASPSRTRAGLSCHGPGSPGSSQPPPPPVASRAAAGGHAEQTCSTRARAAAARP